MFNQKIPPIFEIEMALETSRRFGYLPSDLIKLIGTRRDYDFYRIEAKKVQLKKFDNFEANDIGANVLCVPSGFYRDRLSDLRITN